MESRENPDLIKLKFIKVMKRKILMACAALVVSATAVVGVKVYSSSTYSLLDANLEAITSNEGTHLMFRYCFDANKNINSDATETDLLISMLVHRPACNNYTQTSNPRPNIDYAEQIITYPCLDKTVEATDWHFMGICSSKE